MDKVVNLAKERLIRTSTKLTYVLYAIPIIFGVLGLQLFKSSQQAKVYRVVQESESFFKNPEAIKEYNELVKADFKRLKALGFTESDISRILEFSTYSLELPYAFLQKILKNPNDFYFSEEKLKEVYKESGMDRADLFESLNYLVKKVHSLSLSKKFTLSVLGGFQLKDSPNYKRHFELSKKYQDQLMIFKSRIYAPELGQKQMKEQQTRVALVKQRETAKQVAVKKAIQLRRSNRLRV